MRGRCGIKIRVSIEYRIQNPEAEYRMQEFVSAYGKYHYWRSKRAFLLDAIFWLLYSLINQPLALKSVILTHSLLWEAFFSYLCAPFSGFIHFSNKVFIERIKPILPTRPKKFPGGSGAPAGCNNKRCKKCLKLKQTPVPRKGSK
jgi:hypothetical protein